MTEKENKKMTIGEQAVIRFQAQKQKAISRLEAARRSATESQTQTSPEAWKQLAQSADPFGERK